MMRANESRLFKAAKRTFRAEITLIIVTIIITSWSVYALCKYSFGVSDTVLGLQISSITTTPSPPPLPASVATATAVTTAPPQTYRPAPEQVQYSPPANNDTRSVLVTLAIPTTTDQAKTINNQIQSIASSSSASTSLPEHIEPQRQQQQQQQLTYSPQETKYNWNQLLQDLSADRDSEAIKNIDISSARPYEQLRSFRTHAEYMKPDGESEKFNNERGDALSDGYKLPLRFLDRSIEDKPLHLQQQQQQQRVRRYRTTETAPNQYSRVRNRRRYEPKTYYAPGRGGLRELASEQSRGGEEESRNSEASFDDLDDLPAKIEHSSEDKNQREDDSSEDRQAAESNQDPSELVAKQMPDDVEGDSLVSSNEDTQPDGLETTTETPQIVEGNGSGDEDRDTNNNDTRQGDDGSDNETTTTTPEPNAQDGSREENSDELDRNEEEALKNTGNSIDEEVDRMTQPSSGIASQQERPFNYKNTVQFDDSVTNSSDAISREASRKKLFPIKMDAIDDGANLQVNAVARASQIARDGSHRFQLRRSESAKEQPLERKGDISERRPARRQKRSLGSKIEVIKAPYELDEFLDGLNFDSLSGKPVVASLRRSRALVNDLSEANSTTNLVSIEGAKSTAQEPILNEDSKRTEVSSRNNSAFSPDYADFNPINSLDYYDGGTLDSKPARNRSSPVDKKRKNPSDRYRYLKSNDTALQELLKKKELLDAFKKTKLPAPYDTGGRSNNKGSNNDHTTADSLFTVDHGLLLYPSSDEEHSHHEKSMHNKKKKHESKKGKKKSMIAIKKGGHKKKKHKKEEKKYHKEKKFKGAKKGKKVSKGKGGQGGKKGKKHYKDKGFKKKGFKNVYHKEEFGQKKSYFDEYRDKDFKKKWKKYDDKYNYAQMKKWQAKDIKKARKMKDHGMKYKKYDKSRYKKKHQSHEKKHSQSSSKKKKSKGMGF